MNALDMLGVSPLFGVPQSARAYGLPRAAPRADHSACAGRSFAQGQGHPRAKPSISMEPRA